MLSHAKEFGADIRSTDATAVRKKGDLFEVETSEGVLTEQDHYSGDRRQSELSRLQRRKGILDERRQLLRHLRRAPADFPQ